MVKEQERDLDEEACSFGRSSRRDSGQKGTISLDNLERDVASLLDTIQADLYSKAKSSFDSNIAIISKWEEFVPALNQKKLVMIPFCLEEECEDDIKERTKRRDNDILSEILSRKP